MRAVQIVSSLRAPDQRIYKISADFTLLHMKFQTERTPNML